MKCYYLKFFSFFVLTELMSLSNINCMEHSKHKLSTITSRLRRFSNESEMTFIGNFTSNENAIKHKEDREFYEKIKKLLFLYMQYFILFSVISFHRWLEEIQIVRTSNAHNKSSYFKDLSLHHHKPDDNLDGLYVFSSGEPHFKESAFDILFCFSYCKDYAKVERRVEIYDQVSYKWNRLGNLRINDDSIEAFEQNELGVTEIDSDYIQVTSNGEIYTFPKIRSEVFLGQVQLHSISVTAQQLKSLRCYEKIKYPPIEELRSLRIFQSIDEKGNPLEVSNIEYSIEGDYLIIYPCDKGVKINPQGCRLRVALCGFPCKELTIVSKVYKKTYRTCYLPLNAKEEENGEHTSFINMSSSLSIYMKYVNNILVLNTDCNVDFINVFFCFCFSGIPSFSNKNDEDIDTINWVHEKQISKHKLFEEKYCYSTLRMMLTRLSIFLMLFAIFYIFPEPLFLITRLMFGFNRQKVTQYRIHFGVIMSKLITIIVFLFAKFSYNVKHVIVMIICSAVIFCIIFVVIQDVIEPQHNEKKP